MFSVCSCLTTAALWAHSVYPLSLPAPLRRADFGVSLDLGQVRKLARSVEVACGCHMPWPLMQLGLLLLVLRLGVSRASTQQPTNLPFTFGSLQFERFRRILYTVGDTGLAAPAARAIA